MNKMDNFYSKIGEKFSTFGMKIRDLLKNLGKEYRTITQKAALSGSATEEGTLKGSNEAYNLFSIYHEKYYPKGSAVQPVQVFTESGEQNIEPPCPSKPNEEPEPQTSGCKTKGMYPYL